MVRSFFFFFLMYLVTSRWSCCSCPSSWPKHVLPLMLYLRSLCFIVQFLGEWTLSSECDVLGVIWVTLVCYLLCLTCNVNTRMRQSIWILGWLPQEAIKIRYTIFKVNKIMSRIAHRKVSSSRSRSGEGQVMSRKVRLALSSEHYSGKVIYFLFTIQIDPWKHNHGIIDGIRL